MAVETGDRAPKLTLNTARGDLRIPDPAGRPVLLMFFQEAGTPTCSTQVSALGAEQEMLDELGAVAVCVSTDPPERQRAFAESLGLSGVALASDTNGAAGRAYGVYDEHEKRANRAAFVVGSDGVIKLAIPWYNPANSSQFAAIFEALGAAVES